MVSRKREKSVKATRPMVISCLKNTSGSLNVTHMVPAPAHRSVMRSAKRPNDSTALSASIPPRSASHPG